LDEEIVANISIDVTLVEEIFGSDDTKTGQRTQEVIISRAFDQVQVFDQMLGGYF
jgi:hypothetical protein